MYEDKRVQELAKQKLPLEELKKRSQDKAETLNSAFEIEFALLYETMMWFKTEFFQWMNSPTCKKCNSSSTFQGYSTNPAEFVNTTRIEVRMVISNWLNLLWKSISLFYPVILQVYSCDKCENRLLFPRYNNPAQLLESRTGRCGEWANCFTLFCKVIDMEARYVVDKTDHVWTEVNLHSCYRLR